MNENVTLKEIAAFLEMNENITLKEVATFLEKQMNKFKKIQQQRGYLLILSKDEMNILAECLESITRLVYTNQQDQKFEITNEIRMKILTELEEYER